MDHLSMFGFFEHSRKCYPHKFYQKLRCVSRELWYSRPYFIHYFLRCRLAHHRLWY